MNIFSAAQMREIDRACIEDLGLPGIALMENAALRVVELLEAKCAPLVNKRVAIVCGKGNNGGDGLAIARHLENAGCRVQVLLCANSDELKGDARANYDAFARSSRAGDTLRLTEISGPFEAARFASPDIVLDALLGTGFSGALRDKRLRAGLKFLGEVAAFKVAAFKVAIDLPSGLNADTGEAAPEAVRMDCSVTFAAPKRGMFLRDGLDLCGEIFVGGIGAPQALMQGTQTGIQALTHERVRPLLPHRLLDAHKGTAGRVLICGGSTGMSGAPTLAARAALRVGAGLCIAALPASILPAFAQGCLEATSHALPDDEQGRLMSRAADQLAQLWHNADAVALGPGLSRSDEALDFARRVAIECPQPLLIDADALYALRAIEAAVKARQAPTILTPHPGEMGELMQMSVPEVQANRIETAQECARNFNALVVLKGARSIIAAPNGDVWINLTGNPGMATGGSGDVLSGTICGLLAGLKNAQSATLLGVHAHGLAGDLAYKTKGYGLVAGDIAGHLPRALLELQIAPAESIKGRLQRLD